MATRGWPQGEGAWIATLIRDGSHGRQGAARPTNCIALASYINPATATVVVGPDYSGSGTSTINYEFPVVMARSLNFNCPSGQLEVVTFLFHGESFEDAEDGDYLIESPQPFTFVVR